MISHSASVRPHALARWVSTRWRGIRTLIHVPLYQNSLYYMAGTAVSALFGFLFWVAAARVSAPHHIGLTTSLISSAQLLAALCDLGLGATLIYLAIHQKERTAVWINATVSIGWMSSLLLALLFVVGSPLWANGLAPLRSDLRVGLLFVAFTACSYLLTLHDSAMLSLRQGRFFFWRTAACNVPPLFVLLLAAAYAVGGVGHWTLMVAFMVPDILVLWVSSRWIMPRNFAGYRFFGRFDSTVLRVGASYGLMTHLVNLLWAAMAFAMPLVAVNTLSPASAGYFYINWTMLNFVLIIPRAVSSSLFVEGVYEEERVVKTIGRSAFLIAGFGVPLMLFLWYAHPWLAGLLGEAYVQTPLLRLMLLSVLPFSVNLLAVMYLRVRKQLGWAVLLSALLTLLTLGGASLFASRMGITGMGLGWLLGQIVITLLIPLAWIGRWLLRLRRAQPVHGDGSSASR